MGAAWREIRDGKDFDSILEAVRGVSGLGLEVCCTLGTLTESQAERLKEAGCYAYNHNLDTSPEYYEGPSQRAPMKTDSRRCGGFVPPG